VEHFINTITYFLLREDHFPLTLTLSPIEGEGKRGDRFEALLPPKTRGPNLPPLPPLREERVGVRGAIYEVSVFIQSS
jgi:hypothetical protein